MSRKNKVRGLHKGESYRKDKKLYIFQYRDPLGKPHTLYAKNIVELRKKEDEVITDRRDGIRTYLAGRTTLNYAFDRWISLKYDIKPSTKANYKYMYDRFVRDSIGKKKLKDIKYSEIKYFYYYLINECGLEPLTVDNVQTVIRPVFQMAVRDSIIRINPAAEVMSEIKKSKYWKKNKRHALTIDQTSAFLDYTESHPIFNHWLSMFIVFFETGLRVSELCGLRWEDLDFEKREISVNHQLMYTRWDGDGGRQTFHITTPKSENSVRIIPMTDEVHAALKAEYAFQEKNGFCTMEVDGMSGFVFRNRFGDAMHQSQINRAIKRVYMSYNDEELLKAAKENRDPLIIPHFSCHHMRHTFCTRLCEREPNVKVIQELMGHSDIRTTLEIYAEVMDDTKHRSMEAFQKGNYAYCLT